MIALCLLIFLNVYVSPTIGAERASKYYYCIVHLLECLIYAKMNMYN